MDAFLIAGGRGGEVLLKRIFRPLNCLHNALTHIDVTTDPVTALSEEAVIVQVPSDDLVLAAICQHDGPSSLIIEVLRAAAEALISHFNGTFTKSVVAECYCSVLAAVDEIFGGTGIPFLVNSNALSLLLPERTLLTKALDVVQPLTSILWGTNGSNVGAVWGPGAGMGLGNGSGPGSGILGSGSQNFWRRPGSCATKPFIRLDLIEQIHATVDSSGTVRNNFTTGAVTSDCALPGTPLCTLLLRNLNVLGTTPQVTLHHCINRPAWKEQELLKFIPPEGKCELIGYSKMHNAIVPPVEMTAHLVRVAANILRAEIAVKGRCDFGSLAGGNGSNLQISDVIISVNLPTQTSDLSGSPECTPGNCKFAPVQKILLWRLGHLTTADIVKSRSDPFKLVVAFQLNEALSLGTDDELPARINIRDIALVANVQFVVSDFSVTGLAVESLEIKLDEDSSSLTVNKLFRSATTAGCIEFTLT